MDDLVLLFDLHRRCEYFEWIIPNFEWLVIAFVQQRYHLFYPYPLHFLNRMKREIRWRLNLIFVYLPAASFSLRSSSTFWTSRIFVSCCSLSARCGSYSTSINSIENAEHIDEDMTNQWLVQPEDKDHRL